MRLNHDDKRGLLFSVIFHIICCGLVGVIALSTLHSYSQEPIYDVALMDGGDAAPEIEEQKQEEPEEEEEEEVIPQKDDIVEKRATPIRKKVEKPKTSKPKFTAKGGTGKGTSPGLNKGGQGAGQGPAGNEIQAPAVPPRVTRSRMPVYPSAEQQKGVKGQVVVRFLVGKDGGVESIVLARSSGSGALDQAALNAAGGFRFRPGLDGYGRPIRCYAYQPFAFQ